MQKPSKYIFICLLSFFSLSFMSSALCGGGEFDESNPEQLIRALQEMNSAVKPERFLDWITAAERQLRDFNGGQIERVIICLMPINLWELRLNAQQALKLSAFIDVWIVLVRPQLENLNFEQLRLVVWELCRLGANVQQNQGLSAFIDAWIASAQPKLESSIRIAHEDPIFSLAGLGANAQQNRELPAFIDAWIALVQPKLKDLDLLRLVGVIGALGVLGVNAQQNRELAVFIDELIRLVQSKLRNLNHSQFVLVIRELGRLGANVIQNEGLPAFIDEWIHLFHPHLRRLDVADLVVIIFELGRLGANVTQNKGLLAFIDEWIDVVQPQLEQLPHVELVDVVFGLGRLGANVIQNEGLPAFIDDWRSLAQTVPFRSKSSKSQELHVQYLRDSFFEWELEKLVTADIFERCIDLIERVDFFDEAQEVYNEAVDRQMFGLVDHRKEICLREFFEERNEGVEVVPFARGGRVTVWRAQDQADQFVEGIFNRMDGVPLVEGAERPQEELLVAAVADDEDAAVVPLNFDDVDNYFDQDTIVAAVPEPTALLARILRPTTQEERIRNRIMNENLWQRENDGQTRVWVWSGFL